MDKAYYHSREGHVGNPGFLNSLRTILYFIQREKVFKSLPVLVALTGIIYTLIEKSDF